MLNSAWSMERALPVPTVLRAARLRKRYGRDIFFVFQDFGTSAVLERKNPEFALRAFPGGLRGSSGI